MANNIEYNDEPSRIIWKKILQPHEKSVLSVSIPFALIVGIIAIMAVLFL